MGIGDTLNTVGYMNGQATAAIGAGLGVNHDGVDADGKPRVILAVVGKAATKAAIPLPAGVNRDEDVAAGGVCTFASVVGSRLLVKAGALVAANADVMVDAAGKFITATYTADQYTQLWGRTLDGAAADGDWMTIVFLPQIVYTKA